MFNNSHVLPRKNDRDSPLGRPRVKSARRQKKKEKRALRPRGTATSAFVLPEVPENPWPKTADEFFAVSTNPAHPHNAHFRQVISYWEMAASLVLQGALDAGLFLATNFEGVLLYAKFHHFHAATEKASGNPFMAQTANLIEKYPAAKARYEAFLKAFGPQAEV